MINWGFYKKNMDSIKVNLSETLELPIDITDLRGFV